MTGPEPPASIRTPSVYGKKPYIYRQSEPERLTAAEWADRLEALPYPTDDRWDCAPDTLRARGES
jgi:hypothetical protein